MNMSTKTPFLFRSILPEETEQAIDIEMICFPPNEACTPESMRERIRLVPDLFLIAADRGTGRLAGFLCGIATDEAAFRDAFFTDASLHDPAGKTVMLLGLDVLPAYQHSGLGHELMKEYARREREKGREALILTCKKEKMSLYREMGFHELGLSASVWGGEEWYDMQRNLQTEKGAVKKAQKKNRPGREA